MYKKTEGCSEMGHPSFYYGKNGEYGYGRYRQRKR